LDIAVLAQGNSPFGHAYARAFRDEGHRSFLLSMAPCEPVWPDIPIRILGPKHFTPSETSARLPYLKMILPLRRALREIKPDILFALFLTSGGLLGSISGHRPLVVSALGSDVNHKIGRFLWRQIYRWEAQHACRLHAVSEDLSSKLQEGLGVPPERIVVAPVGIDTSHFFYVEPASRPCASRIVCTRSHHEIYGQATLVRAMESLVARRFPCHLTFAGGIAVEKTHRLVRESIISDQVTFLNGFRYEDLPSILAGADVYVSCSETDGTSNSMLEAMSTGLFPVVSDIPANRPWVKHRENGFLFPVGDDRALADCLIEALSSPEIRARAAPVNREKVLRDGDLMGGARKLLAVFEECLQEAGRG